MPISTIPEIVVADANASSLSAAAVQEFDRESEKMLAHQAHEPQLSFDRRDYADLFERYVQAADGKQKIGEFISGLLDNGCNSQVLDMGAGRGEISEIIAANANLVDAVEPNEYMFAKLRTINKRQPKVQPISGDLATFTTATKYDLILLSYVIESIRESGTLQHLQRLFGMLKPAGRMIGVTYQDGCDWDVYSSAVDHIIPCGRTGGTGKVFNELRNSGLNARIIGIVDTYISAANLEDLYNTLAFFYKRKLDHYLEQQSTLMPELKRFATHDENNYRLQVKEVIYEILPMAIQ